jgi:hypothetical protein
MTPFIIYALPRSRTAWLAEFLSYKDWTCGHEQAIFLRSIDDIKRLLSLPKTGVVETAAAQAWRIIHHHVPNIKAVVIRRPIDDVMRSMVNVDLRGEAQYDLDRLRNVMEYGDRMLREIAGQPGVLSLDFDDLDTMQGCKRLFEFCLPYEFDQGWWEYMVMQNIQVDVLSVIQHYHQNKPEIEGFKKQCWRELRHLAQSGLISKHAQG